MARKKTPAQKRRAEKRAKMRAEAHSVLRTEGAQIVSAAVDGWHRPLDDNRSEIKEDDKDAGKLRSGLRAEAEARRIAAEVIELDGDDDARDARIREELRTATDKRVGSAYRTLKGLAKSGDFVGNELAMIETASVDLATGRIGVGEAFRIVAVLATRTDAVCQDAADVLAAREVRREGQKRGTRKGPTK